MNPGGKIWVVLPAYNEEEALPLLLDSLAENLSEESKESSRVRNGVVSKHLTFQGV